MCSVGNPSHLWFSSLLCIVHVGLGSLFRSPVCNFQNLDTSVEADECPALSSEKPGEREKAVSCKGRVIRLSPPRRGRNLLGQPHPLGFCRALSRVATPYMSVWILWNWNRRNPLVRSTSALNPKPRLTMAKLSCSNALRGDMGLQPNRRYGDLYISNEAWLPNTNGV